MKWLASRRARLMSLLLLLVMLVGCDQATKKYATRHLQHTSRDPIQYLGDTFEIRYAHNRGAFLSLFSGMSEESRFLLLTVMNAIILTGVAVFLLSSHKVEGVPFVALALLLAGGIGNLIDRALLGGIVVDFMVIDFSSWTGIGWLKTGIFNVADIAITCGFLLLLPQLFRKEPPQTASRAAAA